MEFNGLSKEEVTKFLTEHEYTVGSNKISEYSREGLMMQGIRRTDILRKYSIYYTPAILLEFMTASLLHKGNWLTLSPQENHTKLTYRDIYFGRRWFYINVLTDKERYNKLFGAIDNLTEVSVNNICLSTFEGIPRYGIRIYDNSDADAAYSNWTYWQYSLTFEALHKQYEKEILSLPLTKITGKEPKYVKNRDKRKGDI